MQRSLSLEAPRVIGPRGTPYAPTPEMERHWKAIQWFAVAFVALLILAFIKEWFFVVYGLFLAAAVLGFVYAIAVARFDGRPSDEEEEEREHHERAHRHP